MRPLPQNGLVVEREDVFIAPHARCRRPIPRLLRPNLVNPERFPRLRDGGQRGRSESLPDFLLHRTILSGSQVGRFFGLNHRTSRDGQHETQEGDL